jgi:hypothetical protein
MRVIAHLLSTPSMIPDNLVIAVGMKRTRPECSTPWPRASVYWTPPNMYPAR